MTFVKKTHISRFGVVLLVLLSASAAFAQTERGRLEVLVVDSQGAAIPSANVRIEDIRTQQSRTRETDDRGSAVFNDLAPSEYEISATAAGFYPSEFGKFSLNVASTVSVEFSLLSTEPKTTRAPTPIKAMTVSSGSTAPQQVTPSDQKELLLLPNLNNDLTPLFEVVPGAVSAGAGNLGRVILDGKGAEQQTVRLDGFDTAPLIEVPGGDGSLGFVDSFQAQSVTTIDKTTVVSKAFVPIYGPGVGTVSESVTKSGDSTYRFSFYDVGRNAAFDARNFFDYNGKNSIRRHQFGGRFGGPLVDKTAFLFLSFEGIRGRTERTVYEAVPTRATCQCAVGPLASLLNGFLPADAFRTNASTDGDYVVFGRRGRTTSKSNAFNLRLDILNLPGADPSAGDGLMFRLTRQVGDTDLPDGITGRRQLQQVTFMNGVSKARWTNVAKAYVHELKVGFNLSRGEVDIDNVLPAAISLGSSLITIGSKPIDTVGLPGFESVSVATIGGQEKKAGSGFALSPHAIVAGYNFSFRHKDHSLNVGVETRFIRLGIERGEGITYSLPTIAALDAGFASQVTFVSDLIEASPFSNAGNGPRHAEQEYFLSYFQDEWEMTAPGTIAAAKKTLKLTYGLRYDYFGVVKSRDGRVLVVDPSSGVILPSGSSFYQTRKANFQPRVGVAYQLPVQRGLLEESTVRAGFGFYSGVPRIGDLVLPIESDRFNVSDRNITFPVLPDSLKERFLANKTDRQLIVNAFSRGFTTPEQTYKWELALVRNIPKFGELTLSAYGNVARNLPVGAFANPIVRVEQNPDPAKSADIIRKFDNGELKTFGEFPFRASNGKSNYRAMSISVKGLTNDWPLSTWLRFSTLKSQYTFSRNVGNAAGMSSNPADLDADFGYNLSDVRHGFSLSVISKLWTPLGSGTQKSNFNPLVFLRRWEISTTIKAQSGFPLLVQLERLDVVYIDAGGNVFNQPAVGRLAVINTPGGGQTSRAPRVPDFIAGANPYLNDDRRILNPAAFAIPKPGEFGNMKRGALRGPGSFQLDLAFVRNLLNPEETNGITVTFKAEIFNVLNRTNFTNPTAALPNQLGVDTGLNQIQPGMPFTLLGAKTFGLITAADAGRRMQFSVSLKLN